MFLNICHYNKTNNTHPVLNVFKSKSLKKSSGLGGIYLPVADQLASIFTPGCCADY